MTDLLTHFDDYQQWVRSKAQVEAGPLETRMYAALGLNGEAGEVAEIVKKQYREREPVDMGHMREELGDVLWYLAFVADQYGLSLRHVAEENMRKLDERYPNE